MRILLKLYANINLGDDLFLKILLDRYPNVKFVLPVPFKNIELYKKLFNNYSNLEIIEDNYDFNFSFLQKSLNYIKRKYFLKTYENEIENKFSKNFDSSKYDAFISIGGSIFMQSKVLPTYSSIIYYKLAQKRCEHTFFLGCNFGPYNDEKFFKEYKDIFKNATDTCFREKSSYDLFKDLENVRLNPDIVFGLNYEKKEPKLKSVGFSVVNARNGINEEEYITKYAELVEHYQKEDYQVYLFSFCEEQGDGQTIDLITDKIKNKKNIHKVIYQDNIEEFLSIYSSMEHMYCGRFHAMILSMCFNQKIYPIIYSKKMTNVLNDINYQGKVIDIKEFKDLNTQQVFEVIGNNLYNIDNINVEGLKHFSKLDSLINNSE